MNRVAEFVLRHRLVICLSWLVLLVAGGTAAGQQGDRLSFDFSLPGQPGYETEKETEKTYGVSSFDTFVPLLTVPEGADGRRRTGRCHRMCSRRYGRQEP